VKTGSIFRRITLTLTAFYQDISRTWPAYFQDISGSKYDISSWKYAEIWP
jgi:hypothetical protein